MAQIVKKNKKSLGSPNNYPLLKRQGLRTMVHLGIISVLVLSAYYSNTVSLYPKEEASVVAKVRGIITDIRVEEGDFVREGQVLAVIEDASYRIELARTKAELDRLGNELKRSKELFDRQLVAACPGPMYALVGDGYWMMLVPMFFAFLGTMTYGMIREKLPH